MTKEDDIVAADSILPPTFLSVLEKAATSDRESITRTVLVTEPVAKLTTDVISNKIDSVIDQIQGQVTGLVLITVGAKAHASCVLWALETGSEASIDLVSLLDKEEMFVSGRVLISSDDAPSRLCSELLIKEINNNIDVKAEELEPEALESVASECITSVFELMKSSENDNAPSPSIQLALASESTLLSLNEFVSLYGGQVLVELESEQEWPIYPLVTY